MSANANVLRGTGAIASLAREPVVAVEISNEANLWDPGDFAHEQIRGLVRRVFFAGGPRPVKQVVFSAAESRIDVATICEQVARALAVETRSEVVLVVCRQEPQEIAPLGAHSRGLASIKLCSTQMTANLWRVRKSSLGERGNEAGTGLHWLSCLMELRNEFEYAVIEGPVAAISSEAALLGQLTDGIILVVGAHSTRKATARKIKETLEGAQSRILGTVLSDRRFPIPEKIYSRL
jgi:hypothetical protein